MEGPALDVVPEAVLFRGVKEGKSVKRALLVKNTTEDALDVLVTQPLSGVFELVLPESSEGNAEEDEDEPRFFNTIEIPPNETIKMGVTFCPDDETISEHHNFQDVLVLHAAGKSLQVPIRASKDTEVPTTTLRRSAADGSGDEFWPPTEDLSSWVSGLLEELSLVPLGNDSQEEQLGGSLEPSEAAAAGVARGEEGLEEEELPLELEAGAPAQVVKDLKAYETLKERRRAEARAVEAALPPTGFTQRRLQVEQEQQEPWAGSGAPEATSKAAAASKAVLEPTVVVMGRTAFSTIKRASQRPPSSASQRPATPASEQAEPKETLYIIDSGLIDARGQTVDLRGMPPDEVRRRYDLVQCRNDLIAPDPHHNHHSYGASASARLNTAPPLGPGMAGGNPPRPSTEGSSTLGQLYGGNPNLSMSGAAGVNPVALAEAAAQLGMSLADLPPPPGAAGKGPMQPPPSGHQPLGAAAFGNRPPSPSARLPPLERPPSSNGTMSPPRTAVSFKQDYQDSGTGPRVPSPPTHASRPSALSSSPSKRRDNGKAPAARQQQPQLRTSAAPSKPPPASKADVARMEANWDSL